MAFLDVTDVLTDPMFARGFTVRRQLETIGTNGRSAKAYADFRAAGVITAGPSNDLELKPDEGFATKTLTIVTTFRLRGPAATAPIDGSPTFQPDLIWWGGDFFKITKVEDYSHFGAGFVQAEAASIDPVDQPPCEG